MTSLTADGPIPAAPSTDAAGAPRTIDRILTLDITRGVAVMGILSVNIVAMAMIQIAYFYPPAKGFHGLPDVGLWLANFMLVDGKLRSLFSMMFGASTLLVADRAIAAARSPAKTHYARMLVLLGFGYLHWLLLWWGDILVHYAAVGMLLFLFHRLKAKTLFILAAISLTIHAAPSAFFAVKGITGYERVVAGQGTPKENQQFLKMGGRLFPDDKTLAEDTAKHANPVTHARGQTEDGAESFVEPLDLGPLWFETLGLMLLGMSLYRSGFLTGQLRRETYVKVATITLSTGFLVYGLAAWAAIRHGFSPAWQMAAYGGLTPIFRPWMATGYAALIILLARQGQARGWWATHVGAVGRTAFSNYLGSTIVGTLIFFGFGGGLYNQLSRFEAWLFVPFMWAAMLLWSKWWLDRFAYGPLEWLWRSLARGRLQPMRKLGATGE